MRELRPRADVRVRLRRRWTQHTVGVQIIRTAAIIQLLLGNMGRPGGGIIALRGHASIQGSTDIPTLYNTLPGYLSMPHVDDPRHLHDGSTSTPRRPAGGVTWTRTGLAAESVVGRRRDRGERVVLRLAAAHRRRQLALLDRAADARRQGEGLHRRRREPGRRLCERPRAATRAREARLARRPRLRRDRDRRLLVRQPRGRVRRAAPEEIGTEVFFLPAATHLEKDGSFTNTQRLLQWHFKAVEPKATAAPSCGSTSTSAASCASGSQESKDPKDAPLQHLTWDYPTLGEERTRSPRRCSRRSRAATRTASRSTRTSSCKPTARRRAAAGSTAALRRHVNQPARRKPRWEQTTTAPDWGWAWPANRRILYNRASADPDGAPWSERKKLVWWDDGGEVDRRRHPRLRRGEGARRTGRTTVPAGRRRSAATIRSSCKPTAAAGCSSRRA